MNTISFPQTIFYLLLLIIKYTLSDINISHPALSYLCFLGFSFPNPESLTFKMNGWKLYIFIFGLQGVNTNICFLSAFYFLRKKFPISCSADRNAAGATRAWRRNGAAAGWLCACKLAFKPRVYRCAWSALPAILTTSKPQAPAFQSLQGGELQISHQFSFSLFQLRQKQLVVNFPRNRELINSIQS